MTAHRRLRACVLGCGRRRIVFRAALAVGVLGMQQTAAREISDAAIGARITEFAEPLDADTLLSGNLLVARGGQVLHRASFGMANYEHSIPNTVETRFCIASLSKPMTALAVARLVYEERLSLEDPVSTWIDNFPSGHDVTLLQLMTHRAGVPHRVTAPDEETVPMSAQDIVERVKQKGLLTTPGSTRQYSTAGYSVVARIIELVSGKSYDQAMRELLFEPLQMHGTSHVDHRFVLRNRASSYVHGPDGFQNAPLKDLSFLVGGGSLHSTVDDVFRFGQACLQRSGFPGTVFDIFTQQLGWMRSSPVRWNGTTNHFASFVDLYPDSKLVVVFLGNAGMGRASELRHSVPKIVAGDVFEQPQRFPPRLPLAPGRLNALVGTYGTGARQSVLVARDGALVSVDGGILRALAGDRFFSPYYGCEVEFERDDAGAVRSMVYLLPGGGSLQFPRQ